MCSSLALQETPGVRAWGRFPPLSGPDDLGRVWQSGSCSGLPNRPQGFNSLPPLHLFAPHASLDQRTSGVSILVSRSLVGRAGRDAGSSPAVRPNPSSRPFVAAQRGINPISTDRPAALSPSAGECTSGESRTRRSVRPLFFLRSPPVLDQKGCDRDESEPSRWGTRLQRDVS